MRWIWILLFFSAYAQDSLLNYYIQRALRHVPAIHADSLQALSIEVFSEAQRYLPDPMFNFQLLPLPIQTREGPQWTNIGFQQSFPWFGLLKTQEKQQKAYAQSLWQQKHNREKWVILGVKLLYYQGYYLNQEKQILEEQLKLYHWLKAFLESRIATGRTLSAYLLWLDAEIIDLQTQIHNNAIAQQYLAQRFSLWIDSTLSHLTVIDTLPAKVTLWDSAAVIARLRQHPLVQQWYERAKSYGLAAEVERLRGKPQWQLGTRYFLIGGGTDAIAVPSIGIQLPIYQQKYHKRAQRWTLQQQSALKQAQETLRQLQLQVTKYLDNYYQTWENIKSLQEQIQIIQSTISLYLPAYATANTTFNELITLYQKLLNYRLSLQKQLTLLYSLQAQIEYFIN